MIKDVLGIAFFIIVFASLVSLSIWLEYSIWTECRAHDHSWYYCFDLLGRK